MLTQHIALVPTEDAVRPSDLSRVSAAIQKQVTRDLSPIWSVRATVDAFPSMDDVPVGYWPVSLSIDDLGSDGAVHLDDRGQPYGTVRVMRDSTRWSLAASRVCLELLVNPFGDRTVTAPSLRSDQGLVEYLVDVWGPCADPSHSYSVNEILVADFCTPMFFGHMAGGGNDRCSFRGMLPSPLQVPRGGHLSWYDPRGRAWWVRNYWRDNPVDLEWSVTDRRSTRVREWVQKERRTRPLVTPPPLPEGRALSLRFDPRTELSAPFEAADAPSTTAEVRAEVSEPPGMYPDDVDVDVDTAALPPAGSSRASSSLSPVAIAAPSAPAPAARHGLSLLGGAVAGAVLVVFVLGAKESPAHSEAGGGLGAPSEVAAPVAEAPSLPATDTAQEWVPAVEESKTAVSGAPEVPAATVPSRSTSRRLMASRKAFEKSAKPAAQSAPAVLAQPVTVAPPSSDAASFESLADTRE